MSSRTDDAATADQDNARACRTPHGPGYYSAVQARELTEAEQTQAAQDAYARALADKARYQRELADKARIRRDAARRAGKGAR